MIRKLMQHGPSSLTVSLPRKWIDRFGLKKGDDIQMDDLTSKIIISNLKNAKADQLMVYDLKNVSVIMIQSLIGSLYRAGITDVKFLNVTPEKLSKIKSMLGSIIGLEILEESKGEIRLTYMGTSDEGSLKKAEDQIYWKLGQMAEIILNNQYNYDEIKTLDHEINRLSFFIQRNIKESLASGNYPFLMYEKIGLLEETGDAMKICAKAGKINRELMEKVIVLLEKMRIMHTKRDMNDFNEFKASLKKAEDFALKKAGNSILSQIESVLQLDLAMYLLDVEKSEKNI